MLLKTYDPVIAPCENPVVGVSPFSGMRTIEFSGSDRVTGLLSFVMTRVMLLEVHCAIDKGVTDEVSCFVDFAKIENLC